MRTFLVAFIVPAWLLVVRPATAEAPPVRKDELGDPLPSGARFRLGTTRFWHRVGVDGVAFSPDGARVATGGCDELRIWETTTGKELFCSAKVTKAEALAFSPDGKLLAAGGGFLDDKLSILAMPAGKILHQVKAGHGGIQDLVFAADGRTLVTAGRDGRVRWWDVATARETMSVAAHEKEIASLALSPDGKQLLTGSQDHTARLLELASGKKLALFECDKAVNSVAFHPDGGRIALASDDGGVQLWDVSSGKKVRELDGGSTSVLAVAFSPDGKILASVCNESHFVIDPGQKFNIADLDAPTIILWDQATGMRLRALARHGGPVHRLRFSPDGKRLAAAGSKLRIWETATYQEEPALPGHQWDVHSIAVSPDGRTIITRSIDKTIRTWDAATGKQVHWHPLSNRRMDEVRLSPDGKTLVWPDAKRLRLADVATGKRLADFDEGGQPIAISPDGRCLAAVVISNQGGQKEKESTIRLFDLAQRRPVHEFKVKSGWVRAMDFSPDGKLLGIADFDGIAGLLDAATGKTIHRLEGHQGWCSSLAFSPDGALLVTGGDDGTARLWSVPTGEAVAVLKAQGQTIAVAFSPDGRMVAASQTGLQSLVQVWEVASHRERIRYSGHQSAVESLVFSPDGKLLFSGSDDTTVLAWEMVDGAGLPRTERPLAKCWEDLGSTDAALAFEGIRAMIAAPAETTAFLAKQLRPVPAADKQQIGKLLADLDSNEFPVRQKAQKELEQMEEVARAELEAWIAQNRSTLEHRRRVEKLLARLDPRNSPERLQARRALEVLEHIATPESRRLLQELAGGAPEAQMTREARKVCDRLSLRKQP